MRKLLLAVPLILVACGKDKDDKKGSTKPITPSNGPMAIPLLSGISELSLWDYSSEKRCDGIKEYLAAFGSQRLGNGVVSKFYCEETLPGSERFAVTAEFAFDNQTALVAIAAAREASHVSFCTGEFKADPLAMTCPANLPAPDPTELKLTTLRRELPGYLITFVGFNQIKELIYGMAPKDFYKSAVAELSSSEGVLVPYKDKDYKFFLKLTPSDETEAKGKVKIEKIEPESGYQIFGCTDANCVSQKTFDYQIRQHWFTFSADGKLSAFVIPKPNQ